MKNIFKQSAIAMLFMTVVSCVPTEDSDLTVMVPSETPELLAPVDGSVFILDKSKPENQAATIVWDYAKYEGTQTVINYEVEMAKAGTDFKVINVISKTTERIVALTVAQLNQAALDSGLKPNVENEAEIRIKSVIGTSGIPQYSNVIKIKVTPYPAWDDWGIIGSATPGGWDADTDLDYDLATKKYTYNGALAVGEYKFRKDNGWDVNYGDDGNDLTLEPGGANIPITTAGNYTIVIDFTAKTYTITKN
ncbi:hypothetical protein DOS84_16470 [Flavobacterium aquariorum]|uniref:SusE outer membrane protein domain-containing protein n=1 Tax=Flavobacterium aquariorum TaxID=2217670 RepID=A0A2W7TUI3_9FLAO|nr:SusE domain-containing protein [Flavobacterium aquariorum]PZX92400.1 hypothetical protein DOS84_16470 [Flavobacterium aquariorum]